MAVEWTKDGEPVQHSTLVPGGEDGSNDGTGTGDGQGRIVLHVNNSLTIFKASAEDLGHYSCKVRTGVDEIVLGASLYQEKDWWWLLVLIAAVIGTLLLILCIMCVCCVRKRAKRRGHYGVKDIEDGKKVSKKNSKVGRKGHNNRSDIQYSIDDEIDEDAQRETPLLDGSNASGKTPIFGPNKAGPNVGGTNNKKNNLPPGGLSGSEHSLLNANDEDDWIKKGFDEDGSFREGKYAN